MVTAITALILFAVATAEVKGFALMLLIGTVVSLFTAVAATRAMLGLLAGFRWFQDPRFMGATAQDIPRWQRIDVVSRRRLYFIISLVAVGLSVCALIFQGLNLGIDFKGGVQITFNTKQPTSLSAVRKQAAAIGVGDAVVQGRGTQTGSDSYKNFQIRLKKLNTVTQEKLSGDLTSVIHAENLGVKNVSASFSRQILNGAILAIIVSFALIALYVTFRYRWRFAVPILRTLGNDIPIMLGVYAISGREVSADTVAAILTILGYSVYDTIIVFDRVRENLRLMPRANIATVINVSVSEVLKRSIVTSTITLLPIVALFIFGGATLQDFAFAIMVGIAVGAVSTIFIATRSSRVCSSATPSSPAAAARPSTRRFARACCARPRRPPPTSRPRTRRWRASSTRSTASSRAARRRMPSASAGVRGARRGRMDDPGNDLYGDRDPIDRLLSLIGPRLDEVRSLVDEATSRWRGDAVRMGEGTRQRLNTLFYELGLITREDWDDLDLRVAQLEHRLRLLEEKTDAEG